MLPIIGALIPILGGVLDKIFPDKAEAEKMKAALTMELMKNEHEINMAASANIKAEAASSHWLAANWRPATMIIFVVLIVARWFGFAAPNLAEAEYLKLWSIVELGLGGYVIGRSVEKIIPSLGDIIKKK